MFILCKIGQQHQIKEQSVKVGGKKIKHNILRFKKLSHVILHMIM
jgi:hypothetical protein